MGWQRVDRPRPRTRHRRDEARSQRLRAGDCRPATRPATELTCVRNLQDKLRVNAYAPGMRARITVITLGVDDLDEAVDVGIERSPTSQPRRRPAAPDYPAPVSRQVPAAARHTRYTQHPDLCQLAPSLTRASATSRPCDWPRRSDHRSPAATSIR